MTDTAGVFLFCCGGWGDGSGVRVRQVLDVLSSSLFLISGIELGWGQSATGLGEGVQLSIWSVLWVVSGYGSVLVCACSASKIMAVSCPPPLSVGRVSESTLAKSSKEWTVARTPFNSMVRNICCTSSGHSVGKCSLPTNRGKWDAAVQNNHKRHLWFTEKLFSEENQ